MGIANDNYRIHQSEDGHSIGGWVRFTGIGGNIVNLYFENGLLTGCYFD